MQWLGIPWKYLRDFCLVPVNTHIYKWFHQTFLKVIAIEILLDFIQKQPPRGILKKRGSEDMQQIYRRTPMFNLIIYINSILTPYCTLYLLHYKHSYCLFLQQAIFDAYIIFYFFK